MRHEYSVSKVGVVMDHPTPPTPFVHNHTHFTYRILIPDIVRDLEHNNSFSWQLSMVTLPTRFFAKYYIVLSHVRHNLRPDDGPLQGPKHVVLVINIHHYISCVSAYFLNHLIVYNTTGVLQLVYTRGWVNPKAIVRAEANMSLKNPPGIDPGTVRLAVQRLNHYATPHSRLLCVSQIDIKNFVAEIFSKLFCRL